MTFCKHRRLLFFVGTAIILAVFGAVLLRRFQLNNSTASQPNPTHHQIPAATQPFGTQSVTPSASSRDDPTVRLERPAKPLAVDSIESSVLSFDHTQSFAANLERFRLFCDNNNDPQALEERVTSFVAELIRLSISNGVAIKAALLSKQGSAPYRNVLLTCLLHSELDSKQDIAWDIALDQIEDPSVRRTATYVLKELPEVISQPQQMLRLLADPDDQVKVFALQSAADHMDEAVFQATQNLASKSDDIHVRLAAINAIGQTIRPDKNPYLTDLITQQQTSAEDKFSEASLIKRAAIAALDATSPDAYAVAQNIAENITEDPGVRRRAILTCAQSPRSDTRERITTLLQNSETQEAIITKACVQGLLILGDSTALNAVQNKLAQTKDPEIRTLIEQLLINHAKSEEK